MHSKTHMCNVAGIFIQGHMPMIWNVCMPVVMVTLFISLSSCKVDILRQVSHIWT